MSMVRNAFARLSTKLLLLFLLLAIIPPTIVGYLAYGIGRQTLERMTLDHLDSTSRLREAALERWIAGNQSLIMSLAQRPLVEEYSAVVASADQNSGEYQVARDALLRHHLGPALEEGRFLNLSILGAQDGLILVSTEESLEGEYRESETFFVEGKVRTYVGKVSYTPNEGGLVMHISSPILDEQGDVVAVLAGRADLAQLTEIATAATSSTATEDAYLVNRSGFFVTEPRFGEGFAPGMAVHTKGVEACLEQADVTGLYDNYRGVPVLGSYRWLPERELCLITELSQAEAFAPIVTLRNATMAAGAAMVLAAASLGVIFTRTITGPVRRLVEATDEFGAGNLDYRIDATGRDELGRLAAAFNDMAGKRKQAQAELRSSEERYRALVEATAQVVWITNAHGEVVEDISTWSEFTGQTRDETKGWGWLDAIHPEDRERTARLWKEAIQRGRFYLSEYRATREDGEYRLLQVRSVPIFEEDGTLREWVGTCTDITEHGKAEEELQQHREHLEELVEERSAELKRTNQELQVEIAEHRRIEEALRQSEDRFRNIYENAMIGLYRTAPDGTILLANPALVRMLGYSSFDQLARRNLEEVGYEPQYPRSSFKQTIEREGHVLGLESAWKKADGTTLFLRESARAVRDESGNTLYYEGSVEDISARKRAEDRLRATMADLERSNKELEQFAYVASHDLQEPLRMVSSYTQLLARRYGDQLDQDAHDFIAYAVEGAERMQRLINDLLTYSRLGTRGQAFRETDCERALEDALANLQTAVDETDATVTHGPLPTLLADESQLTQIFQNLVSNALKFHSQAPPRVHVAAERGDDEWVFSVADNGIGIDPEYHERIFVIFQRLNAGEEYPGTGIGLALCKRIVERHDGRIWVESQLGEGATFYFTIPDTEARHDEKNQR
jgi:PAS domain S-box-containing protein